MLLLLLLVDVCRCHVQELVILLYLTVLEHSFDTRIGTQELASAFLSEPL